MAPKKKSTIARMIENMDDVNRLLNIHVKLTGDERGRRHGVEVLNKSALVLITACWEAVVEDIASEAFDFMLNNASSHDVIPARVRTLASKALKESCNDSEVWKLAGDGWKKVLRQYGQNILDREIRRFHTPRADNVDRLFGALLALKHVSSQWRWRGTSCESARKRLSQCITDRGSIAHRVSTSKAITKEYVRDYRKLVYRLAVKTSNCVNRHMDGLVNKTPFPVWNFGTVK